MKMRFILIRIVQITFCCFFVLSLSSCQETITEKSIDAPQVFDYSIDTTNIPNDTVNLTDKGVSYENGLYFLNGQKYSGILIQKLKGYNIKTYSSILNGMRHGTYKSFYEDGKPYEIRQYKNNFSVGKQYGYWENGQIRFEYNYYNEKKEGIQKNWYADGKPYYVYNYKNDKLEGLQQAWRENGTLFRNFEVKNGKNYGLQLSKTCFEVSDEKVKGHTQKGQ